MDERKSEKERVEENKVGKPDLSVSIKRSMSKIKKVIRDVRLSEDK